MHELVALGVVDARQLVARAVARQSAGEIRQGPMRPPTIASLAASAEAQRQPARANRYQSGIVAHADLHSVSLFSPPPHMFRDSFAARLASFNIFHSENE